MLDIGWTELLVIGIVALIVVGPKDLPGMFRALGRFTAKVKGMAREFQRAMDEAADESGMSDIGRDMRKMTSPKSLGLDKLKDAAGKFDKWEPDKAPGKKTKRSAGDDDAREAKRAETADKVRQATNDRAKARREAEAAAAAEDAADTADAADRAETPAEIEAPAGTSSKTDT